VQRAVAAVAAQLRQVSDQPPGEAQGVLAVGRQRGGGLGRGRARHQGLQQLVHVAPERLGQEEEQTHT